MKTQPLTALVDKARTSAKGDEIAGKTNKRLDDRPINVLADMFAGFPEALELLKDPGLRAEPQSRLGINLRIHGKLEAMMRTPGSKLRDNPKVLLRRILTFFQSPGEKAWSFYGAQPEADFVDIQQRVNTSPVPRIIHQIWIGHKAPPEATFAAWSDHAKKHGYEYKVWTEKEVAELDVLKLKAFHTFRERGTFAACADLIRYEVLFKFGGIYIDADIYPLTTRALHDRINPYGMTVFAETGARQHPTTAGTLFANSFIATPAGNPVFSRILGKIDDVLDNIPGIPVWMAPGPYMFTAMTLGFTSVLGSSFVTGGPHSLSKDADLFASGLADAREKHPLAALISWKPYK